MHNGERESRPKWGAKATGKTCKKTGRGFATSYRFSRIFLTKSDNFQHWGICSRQSLLPPQSSKTKKGYKAGGLWALLVPSFLLFIHWGFSHSSTKVARFFRAELSALATHILQDSRRICRGRFSRCSYRGVAAFERQRQLIRAHARCGRRRVSPTVDR